MMIKNEGIVNVERFLQWRKQDERYIKKGFFSFETVVSEVVPLPDFAQRATQDELNNTLTGIHEENKIS